MSEEPRKINLGVPRAKAEDVVKEKSDKPLTTAKPTGPQEEVVVPTSPAAVPPPTKPSNNSEQLVHPMKSTSGSNVAKSVIGMLVIIFAGIVSGFGLSKVVSGQSGSAAVPTKTAEDLQQQGVQVGDVIGSKEQSFKDSVEGVIVKGGVDGEGSHHLLRPGGPSQNVYLTSSVLDLDELVDAKVKVWGETFAAQKAGWLMDVGRVEVEELNAPKPFTEE